ncbi:hypothetical protein IPL68_03500 [Candidatus Saccharibacteria bacterium]|nr:MAG: hypothetical protein IPL68_03500 [Candidatus Saccharibacteria bacterium]
MAVLLRPSLLDRTDWYAYPNDSYGSTTPEDIATSLPPAGLFRHINECGLDNVEQYNESMFATGISPNEIAGIVVSDEESQRRIITRLKASGVTVVYGIELEDFVQVATTYTQMNAISHGINGVRQQKLVDTAA